MFVAPPMLELLSVESRSSDLRPLSQGMTSAAIALSLTLSLNLIFPYT